MLLQVVPTLVSNVSYRLGSQQRKSSVRCRPLLLLARRRMALQEGRYRENLLAALCNNASLVETCRSVDRPVRCLMTGIDARRLPSIEFIVLVILYIYILQRHVVNIDICFESTR
jgi:hypothetical protein